jgi:hypothetical protein
MKMMKSLCEAACNILDIFYPGWGKSYEADFAGLGLWGKA